jgi:hypothetical protein
MLKCHHHDPEPKLVLRSGAPVLVCSRIVCVNKDVGADFRRGKKMKCLNFTLQYIPANEIIGSQCLSNNQDTQQTSNSNISKSLKLNFFFKKLSSFRARVRLHCQSSNKIERRGLRAHGDIIIIGEKTNDITSYSRFYIFGTP